MHDLDLRLDISLIHGPRNGPELLLGELVRKRGQIALLVTDAETDAAQAEPRFSGPALLNARSVYPKRNERGLALDIADRNVKGQTPFVADLALGVATALAGGTL